MKENKFNQNSIQIKDLLFFDSLALYYVLQETPLNVLATAFPVMDPRLSATLLSILNEKQKKLLFFAIEREKDSQNLHSQEALKSIADIAQNLYEKGLIIKQGIYFYGKKKEIP
ncbi:MAG: hypothetical protein NZ853_04770 [Leptospiraceae bacterium]|nr:hypothetical protein [Leptospiraceae bacterium]MDW7975915.1 hypothetical protein [Leptospiraceae bacterium]